jgi:hypothetical protein
MRCPYVFSIEIDGLHTNVNYYGEQQMTNTPAFFVPAATPDNEEEVYREFARWCHRSVPERHRRIYSIRYTHDGEEWTATVGQPLRGTRYKTTRVRGQKIERAQPVADPAIVLAIFAEEPFMVVTNHRIGGNVGSRWENPFMAGRPDFVTYFTTTDEKASDAPPEQSPPSVS